MIAQLALLLALAAPPSSVLARPAPAPATAAAAQDKYVAAQSEFTRVVARGQLEERRSALKKLLELNDPRSMGVLVAEFSRVAQELEEARDEARDLQYTLERRQVMLGNLRELAQRDPERKELIPREEERIRKLKQDYDLAANKRDELAPWADSLAEGMGGLVKGMASGARRKAEQQAQQDLVEHPDWGVRAASAELVGRLGLPGSATLLLEQLEKAHSERGKLESRLSKTNTDVRKMEHRLQEETAANQGRVSRASQDQYNQIKREAAQIRTTLTSIDAFVAACAGAGGRALTNETGKDLEKTLARIVSAISKTRSGARLSVLAMLAAAPSEEARAKVRALLESEQDPAAIAVLAESAGALGDKNVEPLLIEKHLSHASWLVRASAASALARLRSRDAIEPLIARLEKEEGRTRSDLGEALTSLTGKDFHGNVALWKRWWADHGATFEVPAQPESKSFLEAAQEQRGVTFFGISTESQRVLFVLDLSGSMKFSMTPKNNPNDDPERDPDTPGPGETSRLDTAKRDLVKAVGGLRDGARFNLVLFASDVWTWADELIEMSPKVRVELGEFIEQADAVGGTNVYGALERAFDLAGAKGGDAFTDPAIDTIYLLTDGKASVGVTTDREEILAFVRSRNQSAGITIHTIGLSDAHDAVLMRRMAEENGGQYVGR